MVQAAVRRRNSFRDQLLKVYILLPKVYYTEIIIPVLLNYIFVLAEEGNVTCEKPIAVTSGWRDRLLLDISTYIQCIPNLSIIRMRRIHF